MKGSPHEHPRRSPSTEWMSFRALPKHSSRSPDLGAHRIRKWPLLPVPSVREHDDSIFHYLCLRRSWTWLASFRPTE